MKTFLSLKKTSRLARALALVQVKHIVVSVLLVTVGGFSSFRISLAQKPTDGTINVSGISSHPTANGTVISIDADAPLSRAQTWQDREGFHVVVPDASAWESIKPGRGVKIRQLGKSVEILVQTKLGSTVSVQPADNRLNLTVDSKLDPRATESEAERTADNERFYESSQTQSSTPYASTATPNQTYPSYADNTPSFSASTNPQSQNDNSTVRTSPGGFDSASPVSGPAQGTIRQAGEYSGNQEEGNSKELIPTEDEGALASIFSGSGALVVLGLGIFGVLVFRRVRSREVVVKDTRQDSVFDEVYMERLDESEGSADESRQAQDPNTNLAKANRSVPSNGSAKERKPVVRLPVSTPAEIYGAYRIDQEVGKLVFGRAHRMDVLASRAPDDRRAIETSLIKIVTSHHSAERERRRAREALEEYGFVARQCGTLLLAPDPFDRTSAARSLGEIGSATALPFLLEGLYDFESIVRNQAVVSLGKLKIPSAIGALLDLASRHPDVPNSLVSRALSYCSVEGLNFFDGALTQSPVLSVYNDTCGLEITHLEPACSVEDLPDSSVDPNLALTLSKLTSSDQSQRIEAVKALAQYQVQTSVIALTFVARLDSEASLRALAISGLASINHESVFPAVLIGLADESREVRAAAARSLSRLSFDRSDAYARVIETSSREDLRDVANACIKAGIVSQNIDRLASSDHRQAYEAFSLICLLAKARMTEPVLDAISNHSNMNVRLSAVHLLAMTGEPEVFQQLRQLAIKDGVAEEVKTALVEAMYKRELARTTTEQSGQKFGAHECEDGWVNQRLAEDGGQIRSALGLKGRAR